MSKVHHEVHHEIEKPHKYAVFWHKEQMRGILE